MDPHENLSTRLAAQPAQMNLTDDVSNGGGKECCLYAIEGPLLSATD